MLINRIGPNGEQRSREIDITNEQYRDWLANAKPTPVLLPNLSKEDILFLEVGMTLEEFEELEKQKENR